MSGATYQIRVKKFITNPLLGRKQFALEVVHDKESRASKAELKEKLAKTYKVADSNCIVLFGFKNHFGGGRSSGFGLIYDNIAACRKFEKRYRLARSNLAPTARGGPTRKGRKEIKNRQKKVRGKEKAKVAGVTQKK